MASARAIEAARAANSLLILSSTDQKSLLCVVEDYFTSPDKQTEDSDLDGSNEYDAELSQLLLVHSYIQEYLGTH